MVVELREQPFHGVRAIRLTPVEPDKMFGRKGILAHSYLLGPNGESNGCVSIGDYPTFVLTLGGISSSCQEKVSPAPGLS